MPNFGKGETTWKPEFKGFTTQSLYLTMRDGVKLAVDVLLPKGLSSDVKIPALLLQTRYWRANDVRVPFRWFQKPLEFTEVFAGSGYALVFVDVRGTGASFGVWLHPWARDAVMDGGEVVDWIISQPWSNGRVGAIGTSYLGASAEFLAVANHSAVKAVVPRFSVFDVYTDIPFPGGIFNEWFIKHWALMNSLLDRNDAAGGVPLLSRLMKEADTTLDAVEHPRRFHTFSDPGSLRIGRLASKGVKPVDSDKDRRLLKEAVQAHTSNGNVYDLAQGYVYRDDMKATGDNKVSVDHFSIHASKEDIERSGVAIYSWGSWFDGATADAVIRRFLTFKNPQLAIIGPWSHGALFHASPYKPVGTPVDPTVKAQFLECLKFSDRYLRNSGNGVVSEKTLMYYTLSEETWKSTIVWPPANAVVKRWFVSADHTLSQNEPREEDAADSYVVDFEATTGKNNRWHTQLGGFAVIYLDRVEEDTRLLTYTSSPLSEDMEITGYPKVTLFVTSTATDGAFHVYLEDIDKTGRVTYVTEGQLRAIHRKVSTDASPYKLLVPYHTFKRKDATPLVPGEVAELTFGLNPTSVLVKKDHNIRIAIAGHDKDTFTRIPTDTTPTIAIARNKQYASSIDLPVIQR